MRNHYSAADQVASVHSVRCFDWMIAKMDSRLAAGIGIRNQGTVETMEIVGMETTVVAYNFRWRKYSVVEIVTHYRRSSLVSTHPCQEHLIVMPNFHCRNLIELLVNHSLHSIDPDFHLNSDSLDHCRQSVRLSLGRECCYCCCIGTEIDYLD